jgi:hypothetical protein
MRPGILPALAAASRAVLSALSLRHRRRQAFVLETIASAPGWHEMVDEL